MDFNQEAEAIWRQYIMPDSAKEVIAQALRKAYEAGKKDQYMDDFKRYVTEAP